MMRSVRKYCHSDIVFVVLLVRKYFHVSGQASIDIYFCSLAGKLYGLYTYTYFCYFCQLYRCSSRCEMHPDSAVSFSCLLCPKLCCGDLEFEEPFIIVPNILVHTSLFY